MLFNSELNKFVLGLLKFLLITIVNLTCLIKLVFKIKNIRLCSQTPSSEIFDVWLLLVKIRPIKVKGDFNSNYLNTSIFKVHTSINSRWKLFHSYVSYFSCNLFLCSFVVVLVHTINDKVVFLLYSTLTTTLYRY